MKTETLINGKLVGNGKWKFSSIKNYCDKKGIELKSAAYREYNIIYGFDYEHIDIITGKIKYTNNSDNIRSMLGD